MRLDETLHIRLGLGKTRRDLRHAVIGRVEQLQTRHLPLLDSTIKNAGEGVIVSAIAFERVKML
ncbi:hypothetical protein OG241_07340 [Streptomyces sp. NBC_01390]|uniref:hypothetical protein n=1 Tax=Streptomyces sp. NBC_01390 TaxID=2903850 RepID=UPI00324E7D36